jgi:hypothetical protein
MILTRQKHIPWSWAVPMAIATGLFACGERMRKGRIIRYGRIEEEATP